MLFESMEEDKIFYQIPVLSVLVKRQYGKWEDTEVILVLVSNVGMCGNKITLPSSHGFECLRKEDLNYNSSLFEPLRKHLSM
jgi:hypothetical protein